MTNDEREVWTHSPRGMMEYFQAAKHTFGESIADLVDNGLDAGADRIEIDVSQFGDDRVPYIAIFDNGDGMDVEALSNAMSLANRQEGRPDTDLGLFGIGMKISSLAQADEVTILSKPKHGSSIAIRRISAPFVKDNDANEILRFPTGSDVWKHVERRFHEEGWSTVVVLEGLHKMERRLRRPGRNIRDTFREELQRLEVHLGLVYERILSKTKGLNISLSHNGHAKSIEGIDPFMSHERDATFGALSHETRIETEHEGTSYHILVRYHIIPHTKLRQNKSKCYRVNKGYKKANDMQGIYYYRNDRLIKYGGWEGLFGEANDEHDKLAKIEIQVPGNLHRHFGLDPNKTSFELPGDFASRLGVDARAKRQWGQIEKGAKKPFLDAAAYRYRNEGKKAATKKPKPPVGGDKKVGKDTNPPPTTPEGVTVNPPATEVRRKAPKPRQVVLTISEQASEVVVRIDRTRDGAEDLLRIIRQWEVE
jgi:hypothetical protein